MSVFKAKATLKIYNSAGDIVHLQECDMSDPYPEVLDKFETTPDMTKMIIMVEKVHD